MTLGPAETNQVRRAVTQQLTRLPRMHTGRPQPLSQLLDLLQAVLVVMRVAETKRVNLTLC